MAKRNKALSSNMMPKSPRKTQKRLAIKKVMLEKKAAKKTVKKVAKKITKESK